MAEATYYDGTTARRRTVSVQVGASGLDLLEGAERVASWPADAVRRVEAPDGVLRLTRDGGPSLARLDVADAGDQAAIRAACAHLDAGAPRERAGRIVFWSLAAALSLLLSVVFLVPVVAERLTPLIPVSFERRLGTAVDNQVRFIFGNKVCGAPDGGAALDLLSRRLRAAHPGIEAEIAVLDSPVPNAIALPGARIYLLRGLLERAGSADEIAGVLGHEIGHVARRDGLRKLIYAGGASYLLGLLFGDVAGGAAIVLAAQVLAESAHSRAAEVAADRFAAGMLTALGRSPAGLGRLLARIDGNESAVPAFLSTHPVTDERLRFLERQVPARTGEPLLSDQEWRALKEICKTT
jgi:Zn-dependent protease with chaperone function